MKIKNRVLPILWAMSCGHVQDFDQSLAEMKESWLSADRSAKHPMEQAEDFFHGRKAWHSIEMQGSNAVIDMVGPFMARVPVYMRWFSADVVDMTEISALILEANANEDVKIIILRIDSPGGTVAGTAELAAVVAASEKPVVVHAQGMLASAALWVAAAADKVIATEMTYVGSIGAYRVLYDYSKAYEAVGVGAFVVSSGGVKGKGVEGTEIDQETIDDAQKDINAINTKFIDHISSARGLDREKVVSYNTGEWWLAEEAKEMGLIDEVVPSFDVSVAAAPEEDIAENEPANNTQSEREESATNQGEHTMLETVAVAALVAAHPNHAAHIVAQAGKGLEQDAILAGVTQLEQDAAVAAVTERAEKAEADNAAAVTRAEKAEADLATANERLAKLGDVAEVPDDVNPDGGDASAGGMITQAAFEKMDHAAQMTFMDGGGTIEGAAVRPS